MASAVALTFPTLVFLTTAFLARNAQAIIAKKFVERGSAVEVDPGHLPWLALLEMPEGVFCTGTIISPTHVLTAATCLKSVTNPGRGTVYAGNVRYKDPIDFDLPTQKRSIVEYHSYDEKNPIVYNFMLVKIYPKWTWSRCVQPIGIVEHERLPSYFTPYCNVSGLGYGSNTMDDGKVARSADMWMSSWRVCADSPQEHLMCTFDQDMRAPCEGDQGGSVLCDAEPKNKLYGIISDLGNSGLEDHRDRCRLPARASGFQFVGFYAPWIKKMVGDLPNDEAVKAIIEQHKDDELPANQIARLRQSRVPSVSNLFDIVRKKRDDPTAAPAPGGDHTTTEAAAGAEALVMVRSDLPLVVLLVATGISGTVLC